MHNLLLNAVKTRYRFAEWPAQRMGRERLFVWNYRPREEDLADFRLIGSRSAPLGGAGLVNTSRWRCGGPDEPPAQVDVFQSPSLARAYESLLELAGNFHLPVSLELSLSVTGEVCLATPDRQWAAFARGNVVARIRGDRRATAPATRLAEQLDLSLAAKPDPALMASVEERAFAEAPGMPIELFAMERAGAYRLSWERPEAIAERKEEGYLKVFSRRGEVHYEEGMIVETEQGEVDIDVVTVDAAGRMLLRGFRERPKTD